MITGGKPREVFDRWQWSTVEGGAILKPSDASETLEGANWQARVMLCGGAGAGKDTVADMLQARARRRAVVRLAFADALKQQVQTLLTLANTMFAWGTRQNIQSLSRTNEAGSKRLRSMWQAYGTDIVRSIDSNYWVNQLEQTFHQWWNLDGAFVMVTDARFSNEVDWGRRNGFLLVKIVRPDAPGLSGAERQHSSERSLPCHNEDPDRFDLVFDNSGDRRDLEAWVDDVLWDEITRRWPGVKA